MRTIYKYLIPAYSQQADSDIVSITMPLGAKIIEVAVQGNAVYLWAIVDTEASIHAKRFQVVGTGWDLCEFLSQDHIGTVHLNGYVWHVFELR